MGDKLTRCNRQKFAHRRMQSLKRIRNFIAFYYFTSHFNTIQQPNDHFPLSAKFSDFLFSAALRYPRAHFGKSKTNLDVPSGSSKISISYSISSSNSARYPSSMKTNPSISLHSNRNFICYFPLRQKIKQKPRFYADDITELLRRQRVASEIASVIPPTTQIVKGGNVMLTAWRADFRPLKRRPPLFRISCRHSRA